MNKRFLVVRKVQTIENFGVHLVYIAIVPNYYLLFLFSFFLFRFHIKSPRTATNKNKKLVAVIAKASVDTTFIES